MRSLLRPEEALLLAQAALLLTITMATGSWQVASYWHPRFLECVAGLALVVWVRALVRARRVSPVGTTPLSRRRALGRATREALAVGRDFAPFFAVLILYETLHDLTPLVRPQVVDARLIAIDRALLGVDVAAWLGRFASPTLTRVMVACYASYFVAPGLLAAAIYFRGERRLFRDFMVSGIVTTVVGYAGYLLVPAVGPYVFQAEMFPTRLPGGGPDTHLFIAAIDDLRGVARDCFPSLHTAHTTVVLVFAYRFRRSVFALYLPVALGLYLSTMYLRMHYAVDVAAGFATAALAIWVGPRLDRWWGPVDPVSSPSAAGEAALRPAVAGERPPPA